MDVLADDDLLTQASMDLTFMPGAAPSPTAYVPGAITAAVPSLAQLVQDDEAASEGDDGDGQAAAWAALPPMAPPTQWGLFEAASPSLMDITTAVGVSPLVSARGGPSPAPSAGRRSTSFGGGGGAMDLTAALGPLSMHTPSEPEAFAAAALFDHDAGDDFTLGLTTALQSGYHPRWGRRRSTMAPGDMTTSMPFSPVPEGSPGDGATPDAVAAARSPSLGFTPAAAAPGAKSPTPSSVAAPVALQSPSVRLRSPPPSLPSSPSSASKAAAAPAQAHAMALGVHSPRPTPRVSLGARRSLGSPKPAALTPAGAASPTPVLAATPSPAMVQALPMPQLSPVVAALPSPLAASPTAAATSDFSFDVPAAVLAPTTSPLPSPAAVSPRPSPAAPSPAAAASEAPLPAAGTPRDEDAMDMDTLPDTGAAVAAGPSPRAASPVASLAGSPAPLSPLMAALTSSPLVMPLMAAPVDDVFDFRLPAAVAAAAVLSAAKKAGASPQAPSPAPAASPLASWVAVQTGGKAPASVGGGAFAFSPSVTGVTAHFASAQPLGATPTREHTFTGLPVPVPASGARRASAPPSAARLGDGDDTLFEFRTSPGGPSLPVADDDDTPPLVGHGPPSMARPRRSTAGVTRGGLGETTLFSYEPDSTVEPGTRALPPSRGASNVDDSLFATTAVPGGQAAGEDAVMMDAAGAAFMPAPQVLAGSPVAEADPLDLTQDTDAYAAALKAKLAAMLAGTPTGDTSLEPPSRSPTPVTMHHHHFTAAVTGAAPHTVGGNVTTAFTPAAPNAAMAPPGSVLRGLPVAPPPQPHVLAQPGLPRRSLGGPALRRVSFMPQHQQQPPPPPVAAPRPQASPRQVAPLSYGALLDTLSVSWKEHVRARRSSVAQPQWGPAPAAPATLDQALRLWCLTAPEVEAQDTLREALEQRWEEAQRLVATRATEVDARPPQACFAAARADDAALQGLREEALRMQRACKAAAKGACARLRAAANAQHVEKLGANIRLLDEQLALVRSHNEALTDVMSGISTLAGAARTQAQAQGAGPSQVMQAAMMRATLAQRQAQLAAAQQARAEGDARAAEAAATRARLAAELAGVTARLDRARADSGNNTSHSSDAYAEDDTQAASAAVERRAEADILEKVCGWHLAGVTPGDVTLALAGGMFTLRAAFVDGASQEVRASAEVVASRWPGDSGIKGRSRADRLALAAHLAAPLQSSGVAMRDAVAPLAVRCGRATGVVEDLEACVAAFPRLVVTILSAEERTVQLKFSINQPDVDGARRQLTARVVLQAGGAQGMQVAVAAVVGAAHMRPAADITADCAAVAPGVRAMQRLCAVLQADLMRGLSAGEA
jgi:hypothetical protein